MIRPQRWCPPIGLSPRSLRGCLGALVLVALGALVLPDAAAAESPTRVAEEVAGDGVFVGFGRSEVDEAALMAAVEDVRFDGLRIVVVVPRDPQPTPSAFARRVQEKTEADAVLVFPPEGRLETYVTDDLSSARIRATDAARQFNDPARAVEAFATEISSTGDGGTPAIVGQVMNALVLLTLVVGIVVAIEQGVNRVRRPAASSR